MVYTDQNVPVTLGDGSTGYPRFGRGGAATTDWRDYLFGTTFEARDAFNYVAPSEAAKVVERNENAAAFPHDATQYAAQYLALSRLMDPTDPDLSAFANHGGKLLLWYGTADTCVSIYRTAQYFDAVKQRMGAQRVASFRPIPRHTARRSRNERTGAGCHRPRHRDGYVGGERQRRPTTWWLRRSIPHRTWSRSKDRRASSRNSRATTAAGDPTKAASFRCSDR